VPKISTIDRNFTKFRQKISLHSFFETQCTRYSFCSIIIYYNYFGLWSLLSQSLHQGSAPGCKSVSHAPCTRLFSVTSLLESGQLTVPRTKTNYGDHSFAVYGPVVWNSLPAELRLLDISLPVFRKRLKMFLF